MNLKGKNTAILGFGIEGKDLLYYLLNQGAKVTILDKKDKSKLDLSGVDPSQVNLQTGRNYLAKLGDFDIIFRSPGVYRYLPELLDAEEKGVQISSATKLFFEMSPSKIIGVTGTKGKGTTSSLIYEILKKGQKDVYLAGNIGKPYLKLLTKLTPESLVVLELSSFQLIDLNKSPEIAVVLNITADHFDWHKDIDEYVSAKKNIVKFQRTGDWAVLNEEYDVSRNFAKETKARVSYFHKEKLEKKFKEGLLLRGEHNLENVAASVNVAKILGIKDEVISEVLSEFKGLEHRLEFVGTVGEVSFYNDSFATGPDPTIAAIKSFKEPETLILGGSEKGLDYSSLGKAVSERKNLKNIILIGAIREKIRQALLNNHFKGKIVDLDSKGMTEIVKTALKLTSGGGVVLLSPAAASFDMFRDYKERGNKFKEAVLQLK